MWVHFKSPEPTGVLNLAPCLDFSRKDYSGLPIKKLIDVIDHVKPTALLGLSTVKVSQATAKLQAIPVTHVRVGCI